MGDKEFPFMGIETVQKTLKKMTKHLRIENNRNFWALLQFRKDVGDQVLEKHLTTSCFNALYTLFIYSKSGNKDYW